MTFRNTLIPLANVSVTPLQPLRIGILHSGGPAPGGNQVLYAAALRAKDHRVSVVLFREGFEHLMAETPEELRLNWLIDIGKSEIRFLRDQVSLLPGTARANPGKTITCAEDLKDEAKTKHLTKVLENLDALGINGLITIGGDDTMRTANLLNLHLAQSRAKGRTFKSFNGVVHVPKTIDKDYPGIDYTFGFMTAADAVGERVKALHDDAKATATKTQLVYHIAEIMGRAAGWLCAAASVYGQATYAIVPEDYTAQKTVTMADLANNCVDVILTRFHENKNFGVITIAEGLGDLLPAESTIKDEYGNTRLGELDLGGQLRDAITKELSRRSPVAIKVRSRSIGYDVRQIKPNIFDVLLCQRLGVSAVDAILEEKFGHMVSVEGVLCPKLVPINSLVDPNTLKVKNWTMGTNEGLSHLMVAMQQIFQVDVDK